MKLLKIGKADTNDFVVKGDDTVSKEHIQMFIDDDANVFITDLNSTNGTFVNGNKIDDSVKLNTYDIIKIGNTLVNWKEFLLDDIDAEKAYRTIAMDEELVEDSDSNNSQVKKQEFNTANLHKVRPNAQRAKSAQLLIWIILGIYIMLIISGFMQHDLLNSFKEGIVPEYQMNSLAESNDNREQLLNLLFIIVYIISIVTFIKWFRRAYYNLNIRTTCSHSEGWASGYWFIPIVSLWKPYQIMKEMWLKTDTLIAQRISDKDDHNQLLYKFNIEIVGFWWTLWVISNIGGRGVSRYISNATSIEEIITANIMNIILLFLGVALSIIAVKMIKQYSIKEEKLHSLERDYLNSN